MINILYESEKYCASDSTLSRFILFDVFSFRPSDTAGEIEISFSPTSGTAYENGEVISYSIDVKNTTANTISNVAVTNKIWEAMSGSNKAFSRLTISDSHTLGSSPGTYTASNSNLDVNGASLLPFGRVTYQIEATVADDAAEDIVLGNTEVKVPFPAQKRRLPIHQRLRLLLRITTTR